MLVSLWTNYWDQWVLEHKCSFDGPARLIYIHPEVSSISVKRDIYSAWKEWVLLYENSMYYDAVRSIGGDSLGGGKYAGDIYFLLNNWKLSIDHSVTIDGVLYADDGSSPYQMAADTYLATDVVSQLVQTVDQGGGGGGDGFTSTDRATLNQVAADTADTFDSTDRATLNSILSNTVNTFGAADRSNLETILALALRLVDLQESDQTHTSSKITFKKRLTSDVLLEKNVTGSKFGDGTMVMTG